jgi:hypothetical protein
VVFLSSTEASCEFVSGFTLKARELLDNHWNREERR